MKHSSVQISSLQEQLAVAKQTIVEFKDDIAAAREQVREIATEALRCSSGQEALAEVQRFQSTQQSR